MLEPVRSVTLSGSDKHDMYQIIIVDIMLNEEEYDSRFFLRKCSFYIYMHFYSTTLVCSLKISYYIALYEHFCYTCYGTVYVSSKLITDKILWALEDSLWPLQIS